MAFYSVNRVTCEIILDFRGVDFFWRILDMFQSGTRLQHEVWERLFGTPGYAALTKSEFSRDDLRQAMSIAFDPNRAFEARSSNGTELGRFVEHFRKVADRRSEIEAVLEGLKDRAARLGDTVSDLVRGYLPTETRLEDIRVAFVFFELDARGHDCIVVDALLAAEMGELIDVLIGHEFHHQCRDAILCYDKESVERQDKDIMWVLNQVQAEGIADHIDKPRWFYGENPVDAYSQLVERYRYEVQIADETLGLMDRVIETGCIKGQSHEEIGKSIREILPLSGHPIGYFMANRISEANLTTEMIQSVGNPFEFFKLYNRAMTTENRVGLSEATNDLLDELEKRYCEQVDVS